jgi:DNA-directed RNA polymerase sigma subunit (sigma70/sigma32)
MVRRGIALALFSEAGLEAVTNNRAKINYLKQYIILDKEIDRMIAEVERLWSRIGKLTPTLSDMPGGGGSIYKSSDTDIIDKIVDLEAEINRKIDRVIDLKRRIEQMIDGLEDEREKLLMSYRYLDGMTFEWIASEMHYHWRSVHKIHVRALTKIQIGQ